MSDAMSAASLICDVMQMHRMADQMDQRRERDAVIDDLINRYYALSANNAALVADYNSLHERFQDLAQDHERQARRIAQLEQEAEQAQRTIRNLTFKVETMQPVVDKFRLHYELGLS